MVPKAAVCAQFFWPSEVLSSDDCRGLVNDDENDQAANVVVFDVIRGRSGLVTPVKRRGREYA